METIPEDQLRNIGENARKSNGILETVDIDGTNVRGQCIEIAQDTYEATVDYGIPPNAVYKIRCFVQGKELHYCIGVESKHIEGLKTKDGVTFIDASVDQFCDEHFDLGNVEVTFGPHNSVSSVQVVPPTDSRRSRYEEVIVGGV